MICLLILFSAADDGYCTTIAAKAVGRDEAHGCIEYWFNRYQSLIGAIATLAAAIVAYRAIRWQVNQGEISAAKRDDREAHAARAVLPLSLSAICEYAVECMQRLDGVKTIDTAMPPWPSYNVPVFPTAVILPLQDAVRSSDQLIAKEIADLIAISQIQLARMKGLVEVMDGSLSAPYRNLHIENGIYDAAVIHARASALFEYARGDFKGVGSTPGGLRSALIIAKVMIENHVYLERRIKELEEAEQNANSQP